MPLRSMSASLPPTISVILSAALATTSGMVPAGGGATVLWLPGNIKLKCSSSVTTRIFSPRRRWRLVAPKFVAPWYDTQAPGLSGGGNETPCPCGIRSGALDDGGKPPSAGAVSIASRTGCRAGDTGRSGRYRGADDRAGSVVRVGAAGGLAQQAGRQRYAWHA